MAAGVADRTWALGEIAALLESRRERGRKMGEEPTLRERIWEYHRNLQTAIADCEQALRHLDKHETQLACEVFARSYDTVLEITRDREAILAALRSGGVEPRSEGDE